MGRGALALLLALVAPLLGGCSGLLFHPEAGLRPNPVAARFEPQDRFFPSGDGETLHGWFFRADQARGTILAFHGNAENLSTHVNGVLWLVKAGFNLFIVDYRGYGRSTGTPGLAGIHRDGQAALAYLLTTPGVASQGVALLGQSLGGSVATYVAATAPRPGSVRALVLDSAFVGYRQIVREKLAGFFLTWPFQYPVSWLFDDEYSIDRWLGQVTVPVAIIHDRDDQVVPVHHAGQLRAAARPPVFYLETGGNGHICSFADASVRKRLADWLERNFAAAGPAVP